MHRDCEIAMLMSLLDTVRLSRHRIDYFFRAGDGLISRARNELGQVFINHPNRYDYCLWIDDDIVWDAKIKPVDRLVAANKDIICAIYPIRNLSLRPAIRTFKVQQLMNQGKYKAQKQTLPKKTFEVLYGTTGFMLVARKAMEKIYANFSHPFTCGLDERKEYLSEDYAFCWRARKAGLTIWADPSIKLGHVGKCVFRLTGIDNL